ncbi:MAG TPA: hypothetical protein VMV27_08720 [Candidatus Binataceae bacterium]|nr:hypothetical protein [Candidatus Binataceae bacterium]
MKKTITLVAAALIAIAAAAPAFAQMGMLPNGAYPGGNANGQYDADFQRFLNHHPNEARALQNNPRLIDNHNWIKKHPGLQEYLGNHPNVRRTIRGQYNGGGMMGGPGRQYAQRGDGDYDEHHNWHNSQWWQQNNPGWWRQHHPEWAQNHPHWYNDGDYDAQHNWHNTQWWQQNHPDQWNQWHPGHGDGHGHGPDHGPDHGPGNH